MKTIYPPPYHHNGFVETDTLGLIMCGYTLVVPTNQRVLKKLSQKRNINGHK